MDGQIFEKDSKSTLKTSRSNNKLKEHKLTLATDAPFVELFEILKEPVSVTIILSSHFSPFNCFDPTTNIACIFHI